MRSPTAILHALFLSPFLPCVVGLTFSTRGAPPRLSPARLRLSSSPSNNGNNAIPEVYPLSRRKVMLIEEAKKLDPSIASGAKTGSYSSVGWSNRLGSVLTPASVPGLYTSDRPFYWNKIDVGCRMTVIQIPSSTLDTPELIVHSPVGIDPPLIQALEQLGTVAHVICPNYEHVKYAPQWARQYPNAKMWGCPGLMEREPEVKWTGELPYGARPPGFSSYMNAIGEEGEGGTNTVENGDGINGMWDWNELQPLHINTEVNPFTGRAFFNEVIYYHAASKTVMMTDLYWNYPRGDGVTNGQVTDEVGSIANTDDNDFGIWELAPDVGKIPLGLRHGKWAWTNYSNHFI